MKKLTVLSVIAASLLLVGCGDSATGAEAKAAAEHKTESTMKCGEGKCGAAMKEKAAETKSAATEAKEAATVAVEKTKEAVAEKATEAKEAATAVVEKATEKATAAVDAAKESAASAVDSAKAAAASAATAATEAVAAATGPDGKALFAKCAGCHGADGKTKAMGKSEVLAGQAAADLETKLGEYKAGTRDVAGMGTLMKGQVAALSDADVKAIAAYVSGL